MSVYAASFSWSDHILDILLVGWVAFAFLVAVGLHFYVLAFGPIRGFTPEKSRSRDGGGHAAIHTGTGESVLWMNSTLNWFYLHSHAIPEFVNVWLQSLNEQVAKLGGPVQVKFEHVQSGTLPPKLSAIYSEPGPKDTFILRALIESRDLSFKMFASQQTTESLKLTNCVATVQRLRGGVKVKFTELDGDIQISVCFDGRPDVKVSVKPFNPHQDPTDMCDLGVIEELVRNSICLATTKLFLSQLRGGVIAPRQKFSPLDPGASMTSEPLVRARDNATPLSAHQSALAPPPKPKRISGDYRLLVKVIKANSLGGKGYGVSDAYCFLSVDNPARSYMTSVVKNTINPFWDEHFLFDITAASNTLTVEVYNSMKQPDDYLGQCVLYVDDMKRTPSTRQILPLQREDRPLDNAAGSVTAEFLFMDPSDADYYLDPGLIKAMATNQIISPRRRQESESQDTTAETTGTTTMDSWPVNRQSERPHFVNENGAPSGHTNHPQPMQNLDLSLSETSEVITVSNNSSVTDTAIRVLMEKNRRPRTPTKTSTLIITSVKRQSKEGIDDAGHTPTSTSSPSPQIQKDKKKQSFRAKIRKRFSRSKKRSQSADRASPRHDSSNQLAPPELRDSTKSTDDIDHERMTPGTPNLKKSRSLGGSLRRLFHRRSRSRTRADSSRESSVSRDVPRVDDEPLSRDSSLKRATADRSSVV